MTSLSSPVWPLKGRREVLNWTEVDSLGNWSSAGQMQSVKEDTYILLKMKANSQSYDRLHKRVLEVRSIHSIAADAKAEIQTNFSSYSGLSTAHQKGTTRLYSSRRVEHHPLFSLFSRSKKSWNIIIVSFVQREPYTLIQKHDFCHFT